MTDMDITVLSAILNCGLAILLAYKYKTGKKIKTLITSLLKAIEDKKIDADETQMIIDNLKDLFFDAEDEQVDIFKGLGGAIDG